MPSDFVKKEELIPTLINELKDGGVNGLGFDSLLKDRLDNQWNDLRQQAINGYVNDQVQKAMSGYVDRVFKYIGVLIAVGVVGFLVLFGKNVYNMSEADGIAARLMAMAIDDPESPVGGKLAKVIEKAEAQEAEAARLRQLVEQYESLARTNSDTLQARMEIYKSTIEKLEDLSNKINGFEKGFDDLFRNYKTALVAFSNIRGAQTSALDQLKKILGAMSPTERQKLAIQLAHLLPYEDINVQASNCPSPFVELAKLAYGKKDGEMTGNAFLCVGKNLDAEIVSDLIPKQEE